MHSGKHAVPLGRVQHGPDVFDPAVDRTECMKGRSDSAAIKRGSVFSPRPEGPKSCLAMCLPHGTPQHCILPDQMALPHVLVQRFGTHPLRQRCPSLHGLKLGQIHAICVWSNAANEKAGCRADVFPTFVRPKPTGRIFQDVIFQHAQASVEHLALVQ